MYRYLCVCVCARARVFSLYDNECLGFRVYLYDNECLIIPLSPSQSMQPEEPVVRAQRQTTSHLHTYICIYV